MASKMIPAAEWRRIKEDYRFYRNDTDFDMPAECREHGDWYNNILVDQDGGRVVDGMHGFDKLNGGKCPFHNSQMCMEVMARCEKLLA